MSIFRVLQFTEEGTRLIYISSLEELIEYDFKNVINHPFIPFGGSPQSIILEKSHRNIIKISDRTYKNLKYNYKKYGKKNKLVDSLIKSIEPFLYYS